MDGKRCWHPPSGKICIELFHRKVQLHNVCQRILAADMANNTFHRTGDTGGIIRMICPVVHSRFNENEIKFALVEQILLDSEGVWDTAHAWDARCDKYKVCLWETALQICHHMVAPATVVGD